VGLDVSTVHSYDVPLHRTILQQPPEQVVEDFQAKTVSELSLTKLNVINAPLVPYTIATM
jgi:hypothetical protein